MAREIPLASCPGREATLTSVPSGAQVTDEVMLWALTATVLATFAVIPLTLISPAPRAGGVVATSERFPPWLSIGVVVSTPEKVRMPPTAPVFAPTVHV